MRLGLMVGPERARYATKVERMLSDAKWAEDNGLSAVWIPQIPDEFDAMTIGRADRPCDVAHRGRHRGRAVADPVIRSPSCSSRYRRSWSPRVGSRSGSARRITGSSTTCSDCRTSGPAAIDGRLPRRRSTRRWLARAWSRSRTRSFQHQQPDVRHRSAPHAGDARRARPGDVAARRFPHRRHDPVAGRREGDRVAHRAADQRGRRRRRAVRRRALSPAFRSASACRARSTRPRPEPTGCSVRRRSRRTTSGCSSTGNATSVGDILAAGDEEMIRSPTRLLRLLPA